MTILIIFQETNTREKGKKGGEEEERKRGGRGEGISKQEREKQEKELGREESIIGE